MQKRLSLSLPAVCPVSHFCTFSELSLAKDTLLVQNFQMEPVLNMVHNPAPHLRTIQEKASVEVILGVWYLVTTFLYLLIDVVLECAHT